MSKLTIAAVAGIAAAIAAGSLAFAAVPDGNGVIHGCYGKPGTTHAGVLRAIDTAQGTTCTSNELPLDWSQAGTPGQDGAPGVSGYEKVATNGTPLAANGVAADKATCPAGKKVLGGGFNSSAAAAVFDNSPSGDSAWQVNVKNVTANPGALFVFAICADVD